MLGSPSPHGRGKWNSRRWAGRLESRRSLKQRPALLALAPDVVALPRASTTLDARRAALPSSLRHVAAPRHRSRAWGGYWLRNSLWRPLACVSHSRFAQCRFCGKRGKGRHNQKPRGHAHSMLAHSLRLLSLLMPPSLIGTDAPAQATIARLRWRRCQEPTPPSVADSRKLQNTTAQV